MSACEKCWVDAHRNPARDVAVEYERLIRERPPCTPEEQAGPEAGTCPDCHRKTLHQYTGEPMCGCSITAWERAKYEIDRGSLTNRQLERMEHDA
jgi:hypothetical protein